MSALPAEKSESKKSNLVDVAEVSGERWRKSEIERQERILGYLEWHKANPLEPSTLTWPPLPSADEEMGC
jgi:hypothetical protein